jgi:hypothetical protein
MGEKPFMLDKENPLHISKKGAYADMITAASESFEISNEILE